MVAGKRKIGLPQLLRRARAAGDVRGHWRYSEKGIGAPIVAATQCDRLNQNGDGNIWTLAKRDWLGRGSRAEISEGFGELGQPQDGASDLQIS